MKFLLYSTIFIFLFIWGIIGFYHIELNPFLWEANTRGSMITSWLLTVTSINLIYHLLKSEKII